MIKKIVKMEIYKATCVITNKLYIGKTGRGMEWRKKHHLSEINTKDKHNYPFYNALRKYGKDNFVWEAIDTATTEEELSNKEKYWIKFYNSKAPNGYNITDGGEGCLGYKPTKETLEKLSKAAKGRIPWNKGIPMSKEAKVKLIISLKRFYLEGGRPWNKGIRTYMIPWNKGKYGYKIHSEEFKIKIGNIHKGENNKFSKLHDNDIIKIKELLSKGVNGKEISDIIDTSISNISMIKRGFAWKHIVLDNISNEEIKNIKPIRIGKIGSENTNSKLEEKDILKIKQMILDGYTNIDISNIFNISATIISNIKRGKIWKSVLSSQDINDIKNIDNAVYGFKGKKHPMAKLNEEEVFKIKCLLIKKIKGRDIAKMFNISEYTISMIKRNKIWIHVKLDETKYNEYIKSNPELLTAK